MSLMLKSKGIKTMGIFKKTFAGCQHLLAAASDKRKRSILDWGKDVATGRETVKIAIVGEKKSGKTVMLTGIQNFINYLATDSKSEKVWREKSLADGWRIVRAEKKMPSQWDDFNYAYNRECLVKVSPDREGWPNETNKIWCMQMDIDMFRPEERSMSCTVGEKRKITLEILDVPGERFSDLSMFSRNYKSWCGIVYQRHHADTSIAVRWKEYEQKVERRLSEVNGNANDPGEVIALDEFIRNAYGEFVAGQLDDCVPYITPSGFILPEGDESSAKRLPCGVFDCGFVPLPNSFFSSKNRNVRAVLLNYKRAYNGYKKQFRIDEVAKWLETANQAFYLVDILDILQKGGKALNGVRHQIESIVENFVEGSDNFCKRTWRFLCKTQIRKLCAVATQVDRTSVSRDRRHIHTLLELLFSKYFGRVQQCESKYLECAAVKSGLDVANGVLAGVFKKQRLHSKTETDNIVSGRYEPMPVPEKWEWDCDYWWYYPEPYNFPASEDDVPPNIDLVKVVEEMVMK